MGTNKKDFRVFYSWQSDSPKKTNLNAIRQAIDVACTDIGQKHEELNLVPDEGTRDTSGSNNIALKILEKIELADVFVADITTVTLQGAERPCPNPNVIYELGYAVGQLGWDRIILLFNKAYGNFPDDLPFDLIQNRVSPYSLSEADPKSEHAKLASFMEVAINAVIEKNPKTPIELRGLSRDKIEHERDVESMEWLMSTIHLPTLDQHIIELPRVIDDSVFWFWESFKAVVTNSLFYLYDPILEKTVVILFTAWHKTLSFPQHYDSIFNGQRHIFSNPGDAHLNNEQQADWDVIEAARNEMNNALQDILTRLRESYIEIDIHKTNAKAWGDFVKFHKELTT